MIPDQYPNYYKALQIYTGYFDSLDIMILFSYPSSIIIARDYCNWFCFKFAVLGSFYITLLSTYCLSTNYMTNLYQSQPTYG